MKKIIKCSLMIVLVIMTGRTLHSQVMVQFTTAGSSMLTLQNLWDFQVNNILTDRFTGFIEVKVTDNTGEQILVAETPKFEIQTGLWNLSNEIVKNSRIDFSKISKTAAFLRKEGYFPSGVYYICVIVKSVGNDIEMGQNCNQVSITEQPLDTSRIPSKTAKKKFPVSVHGYSEFTGVYSTRQSTGSMSPPSYAQWYFNPTISVFDFPVSAQLLLSTRQQDGMQNINSFSVNFDANAFKNILKQRLIDFVSKKIQTDKLQSLTNGSFIDKFKEVENKLSSPGALDELSKLKQLDSLKIQLDKFEKYKSGIPFDSLPTKETLGDIFPEGLKDTLDHRSFIPDSLTMKTDSLFNAEKDSLRSKIKVLSWLEAKKPYYDKLMKQKEEMGAKIKELGIDSLLNQDTYASAMENIENKLDYKKLADPDFLFKKLKENKLFRKGEELMSAVKSFGLGTTYPVYSDLTLTGVPVNGFSMEMEKWNMYGAFLYGNVQQAVLNYDQSFAAYSRNVIGGAFGYGRKEKSHIHFSILKFEDDPNSINPRDSVYLYIKTPRLNQVISMNFKLQLLKNKLNISGELAGSQSTRDLTLTDSSNVLNYVGGGNPSNWFGNIFTQPFIDYNTTTDFAFHTTIESILFKGKTRLSGMVKRIGPEYVSLGSPFMMKDIFTIELKYKQSVWKNRINITAFLRRNNDNLENTKPLTSQLYNWGFDISVNIPKGPTLKAALTPYIQSNDSSFFNINVWMLNSSYSFKWKKTQWMNLLSFIRQDATSPDSVLNYSMSYVLLNNSILLNKYLSLNISNNYIQSTNRYGTVHTYALGLSASYLAFKVWNNMLGGTVYMNQNENRYSMYYQTGLSFLKMFTVNIRAEYNNFNNYHIYGAVNNLFMNPSYNEFALRAVLITKW